MQKVLPLSIVTLLLIAAIYLFVDSKPVSKADPHNAQQVAQGKRVYENYCVSCHGKNLEGQSNWRTPKANGRMPAPPHDKSGHTWHHADDLLFGITKYGLVPPYGPDNYVSDMPGFANIISDEEIWAVLAFIKSQWPSDILVNQQQISAN